MGAGAPFDLVRRGEAGQASGAHRSRGHRGAGPGRRLMRHHIRVSGLALALGLACAAAWAKIPPPPPMDPAAKAAADEKKKAADEKAKAELTAAEDATVQNYQANMKKMGK